MITQDDKNELFFLCSKLLNLPYFQTVWVVRRRSPKFFTPMVSHPSGKGAVDLHNMPRS